MSVICDYRIVSTINSEPTIRWYYPLALLLDSAYEKKKKKSPHTIHLKKQKPQSKQQYRKASQPALGLTDTPLF